MEILAQSFSRLRVQRIFVTFLETHKIMWRVFLWVFSKFDFYPEVGSMKYLLWKCPHTSCVSPRKRTYENTKPFSFVCAFRRYLASLCDYIYARDLKPRRYFSDFCMGRHMNCTNMERCVHFVARIYPIPTENSQPRSFCSLMVFRGEERRSKCARR